MNRKFAWSPLLFEYLIWVPVNFLLIFCNRSLKTLYFQNNYRIQNLFKNPKNTPKIPHHLPNRKSKHRPTPNQIPRNDCTLYPQSNYKLLYSWLFGSSLRNFLLNVVEFVETFKAKTDIKNSQCLTSCCGFVDWTRLFVVTRKNLAIKERNLK
jgi:hypothetical protein